MSRKSRKAVTRPGPADRPASARKAALDRLLEKAARHLAEGHPEKAAPLYRRALELDPRQPRVLHWLGLFAHTNGRHGEAIALMERACDLGLNASHCRFHLAEVRRAAGQLEAAVTDYQAALSAGLDTANLSFGLGNALLDLRRFEEARSALERAVRLAPDDVEAQNNLGNALVALGESARAIGHYRQAVTHDPHFGPAQRNLGLTLLEIGDLEDAERALRAAVEATPRDAEGWRVLARALRRQAHYQEALKAARRATTLAPHEHAAAFELGNVLRELERFDAAADWYRKAIELCPRHAPSLNNLGLCLEHLGDSSKARSCFRQAILAKPDFAEAHFNLGVNLQSEGRFGEAVAAHEQALALAPTLAEARYSLALIGDRPTMPHDLAALEALAESLATDEEQRAHACFALARHIEDTGDVGRAFAYYQRANELKKSRLAFEPERHASEVDRLIAVFSANFFTGRPSFVSTTERPIVIVGMPRSGTSLVEQILASHPAVHGAGELDELRWLVASLPERLGTATPYPECAAEIDLQTARALAEDYLASLGRLAVHAERVTDKMPGNYLRLGLVGLLFPRAAIIHCRRDPLDTCLSCYFQNFRKGQSFSYDLRHLGVVYCQYERLMAHWRKVLPNPILDLDYEALIADQEGQSRRLVDFCGLPWDPRCLRFHEHGRPVRTASFWQVRQPLYNSAVGRWRRFAPHLGPLFEALDIVPPERG